MRIPLSGSDLVGQFVEQVVCSLLREFNEASEVSFFIPPVVPPIQERVRSDGHAGGIIDEALKIRQELGLPFWDAANLACFGRGEKAAVLLSQALFHNGSSVRRLRLPVAQVTVDAISRLAAEEEGKSILVWSSRVETCSGKSMHVPMLDFHCPESPQNLDLVKAALRLLDIGVGYIIASGKSYHFYGRNLVNDEQRVQFLARALLLSPIVDRTWIAHQLIEGACGLRVSARSKAGSRPQVIALA